MKTAAMLAATALLAFASAAQAAMVTDEALYMADQTSQKGFYVTASAATGNTGNFAWYGMMGKRSGTIRDYVVPFQLPDLGVGGSFTSADLQVSPYRDNNLSATLGFDLYGMSDVTDSVSVTSSFFYAGTNDTANSLIQATFLSSAVNAYHGARATTNASGDAALLAWLNAAYDGGTNAGKYVYLRFTPNAATIAGSDDYMQILTTSSADASVPALMITYSAEVLPEPASLALLCGGAIMVIWRQRRAA